jgi:hypothetical protein
MRIRAIAPVLHVVALAASVVVAASCSGTAVLGTSDPLACESGHGCGSVFCACEDQTVLLASLCEEEECQDAGAVCGRRCADGDHGALVSQSKPEGDAFATPECPTLCTRLLIGGCELGCEPYFDACAESAECSPAADALLSCLANQAVVGCEAGAVSFSGCAVEELALCSPGASD